MNAFRTGSRPATVMDRIAKGFTDEEIAVIAKLVRGAEMKASIKNAAHQPSRRHILRNAAAVAAAALCPHPSIAQSRPRVVIVGGGFGGASCARALRRADARLAVTLVEPRRIYTAPPLSNAVLAGLRPLAGQQFGYDKIAAAGITVVHSRATAVDPQARTVTLETGDKLSYDRLVLAPGIDLRFDAIPGYSEAAAARVPHAWTADGGQIDAAAPPDRGDGGRRRWWRSRCRPIRRAVRRDLTSAPA